MRKTRVAVGLGMALLATSIVPTGAQSAIYEVHACRLPSGAPAPAHGWTTTSAYGPGAVSQINCPGGAMTSQPAAGQHNQNTLHGFSFTAPPGTSIEGLDRQADGVADSVIGRTYWSYGEFGTLVGHDDIVGIGQCGGCGAFTAGWLTPHFGTYRLSRLLSALKCEASSSGDTTPCQANGSHFALRWINVHLEDLKSPQVLSASGSLLAERRSAARRALPVPKDCETWAVDYSRPALRSTDNASRSLQSTITAVDAGRPLLRRSRATLGARSSYRSTPTDSRTAHHAMSVPRLRRDGVNSAVYGPVAIDVDNVPDPRRQKQMSARQRRRQADAASEHQDGSLRRCQLGERASGGPSLGRYGAQLLRLIDGSNLGMPVPAARIGRRWTLRTTATSAQPRQGPACPPFEDCNSRRHVADEWPEGACWSEVRRRAEASAQRAVHRMSGRLRALPVPGAGKTVAIQARAEEGRAGQPSRILRRILAVASSTAIDSAGPSGRQRTNSEPWRLANAGTPTSGAGRPSGGRP